MIQDEVKRLKVKIQPQHKYTDFCHKKVIKYDLQCYTNMNSISSTYQIILSDY